jgi:hypothetical protein
MRVFRRGLILAALFCASAPSVAGAAPIGLGDDACTGLVASPDCRLLTIDDPFTFGGLEGGFETYNDVALFALTFTEATRLTVTTTSHAGGSFDPTFGLFHEDGSIVLLDTPEGQIPARFFDIDLDSGNYDDQIDLVLSGNYLLALIAYPNDFGGIPGSLQEGFTCDPESCPGTPGAFAFTLTATVEGQPQPVPEPGTLALLATGALAALVRRRSRKRV